MKRGGKKNPSIASVLYARRGKGPLLWFDGKKFTNNNPPKYFGTYSRAKAYGGMLLKKYETLRGYKLYVGLPRKAAARRKNPESRTDAQLDTAAEKLEDFSGHPARTVLKARTSGQRTGLVIGELDQIGYITKREGINGGKLTRYVHDFKKTSRPLLAVTTDGKQLHIVGGRYEFTEAGVEDR